MISGGTLKKHFSTTIIVGAKMHRWIKKDVSSIIIVGAKNAQIA